MLSLQVLLSATAVATSAVSSIDLTSTAEVVNPANRVTSTDITIATDITSLDITANAAGTSLGFNSFVSASGVLIVRLIPTDD